MLQGKKLIMFDMDGTLIDSSPDLAHAINHMLQKLGRNPVSKEAVDSWLGNGAQMLVKRALSNASEVDSSLQTDLIDEAQALFLAYYASHLCIETQCYPQVPETLEKLHAAGFSMVLITNKPLVFVSPILEKLGIAGFFEKILGGDSLERKKPDPLPLQHMMAAYGVLPQECMMVGDSKNDILAAKAADVESIAVTYGYNYAEPVTKYHPDYAIDHFADILVEE